MRPSPWEQSARCLPDPSHPQTDECGRISTRRCGLRAATRPGNPDSCSARTPNEHVRGEPVVREHPAGGHLVELAPDVTPSARDLPNGPGLRTRSLADYAPIADAGSGATDTLFFPKRLAEYMAASACRNRLSASAA